MKTTLVILIGLLLLSSIAFSQRPMDEQKFIQQTDDIRLRLDSFKGNKEPDNPTLINLLSNAISFDSLIAVPDTLFKNDMTRPDIKTITHVLNIVVNKYVSGIFNPTDFIVIPNSRSKWVKTLTDCSKLLDSVIFETEVSLRINDLFKEQLEKDSIIKKTDTYKESTLLSDFFVSGFSLSPLLNNIVDSLKKHFDKLKVKSISLTEASNVATVKDCLDLIKIKAGLTKSTIHPITRAIIEYIPKYFTVAKSSDEIVKPRSSRSPFIYSVINLPKSRLVDIYMGINLFGFINNYETWNIFLGPIQETHLYVVNDKDSVSVENWGGAIAVTKLFPKINNIRLKFFGYYARRNDYRAQKKGTQIKGSASFSFESRDCWRYILPSYEPIGFRNESFEYLSYTWSPSMTYDFIKYGTSDSEKLGPLSTTINVNVYAIDRIFEFSATWKHKVAIFANSIPSLEDFKVYREFAIKLNTSEIKSPILKPIVKDLKLSLGFIYQDGINVTTGSNDVIRSLAFGFIF